MSFGIRLLREGNNVLYFPTRSLFTFPVKHRWYEKADLELIRRSVVQFGWVVTHASQVENIFVMPRPGCGFGRLTWEEVRPIVAVLPDNVHVITR